MAGIEAGWAALMGYALGSIPFGLILTSATGAGTAKALSAGTVLATRVNVGIMRYATFVSSVCSDPSSDGRSPWSAIDNPK